MLTDLKSAETSWTKVSLSDCFPLGETETSITDESPTRKNSSTDLVRLYLRDIGKVDLLGKDEEVKLARQIQAYIDLLALRETACKNADPIMQQLVQVLDIAARLTVKLGYRPSWQKWAKTANLEVEELQKLVATGKQRWANLAQIEVEELETRQKTGMEAKEKMIAANLRLVVSIAKKYQNRGLELLDLIQEGTLGLEKAVEKFDATKGYRFSTYAYWWIRQGITRAIATQSHTIRIPVHITEKLNKIKKAQRKIAQQKGHTPSLEEIAQELGNTPKQVRDVLARVPRSVSLEMKVGRDQDTELGELLETHEASPEEVLVRESLSQDLEKLMQGLTGRERAVINLRYGLDGGKCHSLADIGRALALSRERVRQIETKALQKLRHPQSRHYFQQYLD